MIWVALVLLAIVAKAVYDTHRISKRLAARPLHEADIIAASEPNGHVDIVGGGFRVR